MRPVAITIVPGSHTSASALMSLIRSPDSDRSTTSTEGLADTDSVLMAFLSPPLLIASTGQTIRSEEHTSELKSQMRSSYAGFSLKKKNKKHTKNKEKT